jgi:predicted  nucleic acid-binding Zn-ribbon protein
MSAALGLFRLQQVDSQIDQIRARLKSIQDTLDNDRELRTASEQLAAADSRNKEAVRALNQAEADFEKQRVKIEQIEASLYGGQVHNPKELQDLQKDVVSLKKYHETLESRELEAMMVVESTEGEWQAVKAGLEQIQSRVSIQHKELMEERESLQKDIETLESERNAVMNNLDGPSVKLYNQLRQQRRGIAVATLTDSSCSACGSTLTPSQQQIARSTIQLFLCPTCGRILYAN